jgi:hypothetical protein
MDEIAFPPRGQGRPFPAPASRTAESGERILLSPTVIGCAFAGVGEAAGVGATGLAAEVSVAFSSAVAGGGVALGATVGVSGAAVGCLVAGGGVTAATCGVLVGVGVALPMLEAQEPSNGPKVSGTSSSNQGHTIPQVARVLLI